MERKLKERLSKLEGKLAPRQKKEDPESYKIAEFFNRLLSTMREDHRELLMNTLRELHEHDEENRARIRRGEPSIGPWSNWDSLGGRLLWAANSLFLDYFYGEGRVPVALPPEVCEVYLRDEEAGPYHDCEDCGYPVPVAPGKAYFPVCPLCGGETGYYAYYEKHKGENT